MAAFCTTCSTPRFAPQIHHQLTNERCDRKTIFSRTTRTRSSTTTPTFKRETKRMGSPSMLPDGEPCVSYTTNERVRQLYAEQRASPVFDPSLVTNTEVRAVLTTLQSSIPPASYLRHTHLHPHSDSNSDSGSNSGSTVTKASLIAAETIGLRATAYCALAKRAVLLAFPDLDRGALHGDGRADACWRDINSLMRVTGYVCVAPEGLSNKGVGVLKKVYNDRGLTLDVVIVAMHAAKDSAKQEATMICKDFGFTTFGDVERVLDMAFETLTKALLQ